MNIMSAKASYAVGDKTDTSTNQLDAILEAVLYRGFAGVSA